MYKLNIQLTFLCQKKMMKLTTLGLRGATKAHLLVTEDPPSSLQQKHNY